MSKKPLSTEIVFLAARRTAFGTFNGALKGLTATDLGVHAAQAAIAQSGVPADQFGHVYFGNVLQSSKDAIYQEVFNTAVEEWVGRVMEASEQDRPDRGWSYVEDIITTAFWYFTDNPEVVTILRRELLTRDSKLDIDLAESIRPIHSSSETRRHSRPCGT